MGLLDSLVEAAKQQYQTTKRGFGLLASNPQQFAQEATARYFPTKEEEAQFAQAQATGDDYTQTPYYQKVMNLSQFQGSIKPTGLINAPQQAALDLAQKNAALPVKQGGLGLPENNTAADRAKAMGFNEGGYTGTNRDINLFDPSKAGASGSGSREGPLGTWLTNDPKVASGFADWSARGQGGNVVYPLMIRGKSPKEFSSYSEIKDLIDANTQFKRPPYRMMQDTINYENAKKSLGDYGVLRNTMTDAIDVPITQYVVPDPSRLRSKFAAFDPARVNESDLLAAGVPLGLLGTAQQTVNLPEKKKSKK
jgi:hypothetical protein